MSDPDTEVNIHAQQGWQWRVEEALKWYISWSVPSPLCSHIKSRRLKWVYYDARMENNRNYCKILMTNKPMVNNKLRERKVKTPTRNWRDHRRTGTHKHTETVSRYFDWHGHLSQSKWLLARHRHTCEDEGKSWEK